MKPAVAPRPAPRRSWLHRLPLKGRKWVIALMVLLGLGLAVGFADILLDRPLRDWAERTMNAQLKGYTVKITRFNTHLWRLAMEVEGLTLVQNSHPESPVADIGALKFSVVWRQLLRLRLVGDLTIQQPNLRINLAQLQEEARSDISLKERGWQDAVEAIYPLKLDEVKVTDGSLLYLSVEPSAKPIRLTKLYLTAHDVRNIRSEKGTFPSPVHLEAVLFDTGKLWFDGAADFLAKPNASIKGEAKIEHVPLDRLDPLTQNVQLRTKGGLLSAHGSVEYTPQRTEAILQDVRIDGLKSDYVTSEATKTVERQHGKAVVKAAKRVSNAPRMLLRIDRFRIAQGELGFINQASAPQYRLFISDLDLEMDNLSNQFTEGEARFEAKGAFMGSGRTRMQGGFRPDDKGADFDIHMQMEDTQLSSLNNLLRAYAKFDVSEGLFSLFTEITVKDQRITGYIKPLVRNLKVYDKRQDQGKGFFKRLYEHVVQGLANLLRNRSRKELATVAQLSGRVTDPQASNLQVVLGLIRNGFFDAILPGFLEQVRGGSKRDPVQPAGPAPKGGKPSPAKSDAAHRGSPPGLPREKHHLQETERVLTFGSGAAGIPNTPEGFGLRWAYDLQEDLPSIQVEQGLAGVRGEDAGQVLQVGAARLQLLQQGPRVVVEGGQASVGSQPFPGVFKSALGRRGGRLQQGPGTAEVGDQIGGHPSLFPPRKTGSEEGHLKGGGIRAGMRF